MPLGTTIQDINRFIGKGNDLCGGDVTDSNNNACRALKIQYNY